ncbi:MAG: ribonuclease III [Oscillospiraceae bacterium]|nr:ribonuclease III [Oscillospiraceae bacterium]
MRDTAQSAPLMAALGHRFKNQRLLSLALTHPSAGGAEGDNQRLEFLGDAVLELCVSEALFARHAEWQEGDLTQMRAALVREESLARAARKVNLGAALLMDHGEESSGGRDKPSVLADAMEAVLAAIYLDAGLDAVRAVCAHLLDDFTPVQAEPNWKSLLQEKIQAGGAAPPEYRLLREEGPPHARLFTAEVRLADGRRGEGRGASKKQAEQEAAKALLERG